ncbi:Tn3 family transposase [Nonomuraea muscovyensis]|uniref:Tn3 family transposase n=1 Tax=Nonomuraea muscovyensis TaxID=1124761 RepID=UPI0033D06CE5
MRLTTVHADAQGQSQPVFALAHLLGFDLMPRIRNWKGRPSIGRRRRPSTCTSMRCSASRARTSSTGT